MTAIILVLLPPMDQCNAPLLRFGHDHVSVNFQVLLNTFFIDSHIKQLSKWFHFTKYADSSAMFLGGLSLHLNHLIAEHMSAPYWQFGTLPIGIFLSNLVSGQFETSLMTSFCHF